MSSSRYDDFIDFQAAIVRAVGMSWNADAKFKSKFLKDPLAAMKEAFGYECPFDVKFEAKESGPGNEHYFDGVNTGGWVGTNNTVELCLPPAPAREQRSEALAAYNQESVFFLRAKSAEGKGK